MREEEGDSEVKVREEDKNRHVHKQDHNQGSNQFSCGKKCTAKSKQRCCPPAQEGQSTRMQGPRWRYRNAPLRNKGSVGNA